MQLTEQKKSFLGIALCVVVFVLGQVLLEVVSKLEDPPLGNTFYIILGCTFMVGSLLAIYFLIKHLRHLRRKKIRRHKSKIVFLDDEKRIAK